MERSKAMERINTADGTPAISSPVSRLELLLREAGVEYAVVFDASPSACPFRRLERFGDHEAGLDATPRPQAA